MSDHSNYIQWKDIVGINSCNSSQFEVLHLQQNVLVKLNCDQTDFSLKEGSYGYFSCVVQNIRHNIHGTTVTVRLDHQTTSSSMTIAVKIGNVIPFKRMHINKSSIQVGQLVLTATGLSGVFGIKRVERVEYSDQQSVSERVPTVMFCSTVEMRSNVVTGDTKEPDDSPAAVSSSSSGGLERMALTDGILVLQNTDRTVFYPSTIVETCVALKLRLVNESPPPGMKRRIILDDIFSAEQCRGFESSLSTIIVGLSTEADQAIKFHLSHVSELLTPVFPSGHSSCGSQLFQSDTFVHIFRILHNACIALTHWVSVGTTQSTGVNTDSSLGLRDADQVHGFQIDSPNNSPQKAKPLTANPVFSHSVADLTEKELFVLTTNEMVNMLVQSISCSLLPLMSTCLPVPFDISTENWSLVVQAVCLARFALSGLLDAIARIATSSSTVLNGESVFLASNDQLVSVLSALDAAFDDYRDRAVMALCDSYELSVVDSMHRQEWSSNNAFFRDKKISHGVLALSSSVRATLHDLSTFCGTGSRGRGDRFPETVTYVSLQLLLAAQSMCLRNYLMLRPSRVRLFQWRLDLCHVLYTTMDSLAQLVTYKRSSLSSVNVDSVDVPSNGWGDGRSLTLSQISVGSGGIPDAGALSYEITTAASDLDVLFTTNDERFLWAEIAALIVYTIMTIVVVTNTSSSDVGDLLLSLQSMVTADQSAADSTLSDAAPFSLVEVVDLFKLVIDSSVVDHAFNMPDSSGSHPPSFDLTGDVTAYCGHFSHQVSAESDTSPSLHLVGEDERVLFTNEQKAKTDNPYAGTRGVIFARIAGMLTTPVTTDSSLWADWHRRRSAAMDLHCELRDDDDSTVRSVSALLSSLLPRRFEMQTSEYPKLTDVQTNNAMLIRAFLNRQE